MARKSRPHLGEVVVSAYIPKGVSAADFRKFVKHSLADLLVYPTFEEEEKFGTDPIKLRMGRAKVTKKQ